MQTGKQVQVFAMLYNNRDTFPGIEKSSCCYLYGSSSAVQRRIIS